MKLYKTALLVSIIPSAIMVMSEVKLGDSPSFEDDFIQGSKTHEKLYLVWLRKKGTLPKDLKKYPEVEVAWDEYRAVKSKLASQKLVEALDDAAIDFEKPHFLKEVMGTGVKSEVKKISSKTYANYLTLKKTLPAEVEDDLKNYPEVENALIEYRKAWGALDDTNVADDNLKMAADANLKVSKQNLVEAIKYANDEGRRSKKKVKAQKLKEFNVQAVMGQTDAAATPVKTSVGFDGFEVKVTEFRKSNVPTDLLKDAVVKNDFLKLDQTLWAPSKKAFTTSDFFIRAAVVSAIAAIAFKFTRPRRLQEDKLAVVGK